ncbi:hypothetical protein BIV57_13245 [Mangrovactinospora gilvigrisea]|uniref:DUF4034 domain-containing protein n=1 Tax=Mangrovactinospora gilvigrisea TaxID=1428644 RepID=A0A1J7BU31_9ACTN|nr:hypothetical protein [Mangrovactinospora gilvigrisea]OIV36953.1 hypothetical protein BIV57_13245 [Mangrovactinospora gilvigrisea]
MAPTRPAHQPGSEQRVLFDPAGPDAALRAALAEAAVGHWVLTRDLLAATGTDWGLRASRTQVLAAAARRTDLVASWLAEEPHNPDAQVMAMRVAAERAVSFHRMQHIDAPRLRAEAEQAAWAIVQRMPSDPLPYICLLTLAQLDPGQPEHQHSGPDQLLPAGPWRLLNEAHARDPFNREAYIRMFQFWSSRSMPGAAYQFAQWAAEVALPGTAPLVLPLYGHVASEQHGSRPGVADLSRSHWRGAWQVRADTDRALNQWFAYGRTRSIADLSHLAYALTRADRLAEAARVFAAMGPYAHSQPWAQLAPRPELIADEISRAREQAYSAAEAADGQQQW